MTLVITGHNLKKGFSWNKSGKMEHRGLFVASDSAITANGKPLLGGFRKVYPIQIKIWKPYFLDQYFHSYREVYFESECFIAISGSTLTAQHVLNFISEHLGKLRITCEMPSTIEKKVKYKVIRHCQSNALHRGQGVSVWSDDMFTPNDYKEIENASVVADIIEYSINEALSSARKYKLDSNSLKSMYTEFAAGIYCPVTKNHKLYVYKMDKKINEGGIFEVFVNKTEIHSNQVAVLGMNKAFGDRAQIKLDEALSLGVSPAKEMFKFLNEAIDEVVNHGSSEIDRPSVLRVFHLGSISREDFKP